MENPDQAHHKPDTGVEPRAETASTSTEKPSVLKRQLGRRWPMLKIVRKYGGLVALCVASSAATAWILLGTGVIKPDATQTITQNRQSIVLQQGEIVADVFKRVSPSTVAITTESQANSRQSFGANAVEQAAGSGIIISADGYILTNKHVVANQPSKLTVVLADGTTYSDVTVAGLDPLNDIAFLKINGVRGLPAAELGDSDTVQPGQQVVAIGNALGQFRNSVTSGIISGKGRPIQADDGSGSSEQLENLLQTDAAINPGNSGGPLVTLDGKVVGINTAVSQDGQAIGFAIPINDAKGLVNGMLKQGRIVRPYLGVRYISLDKATAQQLNLNVSQGAYIAPGGDQPSIVPGSPADKAGLQPGDVITKVDDKDISDTYTLASALAQRLSGDKLTLTIVRGGKTQTVSVTLSAYPDS